MPCPIPTATGSTSAAAGARSPHGQPLGKLFTGEDQVLELVEKAICFFRDEGIAGERFADTINRLGFDYVEEKLSK